MGTDRNFYRVVGAELESNRPGILTAMPDVGGRDSASSAREAVHQGLGIVAPFEDTHQNRSDFDGCPQFFVRDFSVVI